VAQNINDQISQRIQAFAKELEALVRQAAIDAVTASLGGTAVRTAAPAVKPAAAKAAPAARKAISGGGGKRPPELLAEHVAKAAEWIKGNPGHGVEDMAKALGLDTKDLALPIQKLLANKTISRRGVKRATKYFPKK
jgi:hypothetical protein